MSNCFPFSSPVEPGWGRSPYIPPFVNDATREYVNFTVPINTQILLIPLAVTKSSSNLILQGPPCLTNTTDTTPSLVVWAPVGYSTTTVTVLLSAVTTTVNYRLQGFVFVVA